LAHPKRRINFNCPICNQRFERLFCEVGKALRRGATHFYCSLQCAGKAHRGDNNPQWKGGITKRPPLVKITGQRKSKALGYCERCGSTENLHGHHKLHYSTNPLFGIDPSNIEVLCAKCHSLEHPEFATLITRPIVKTGKVTKCKVCGIGVYSFPSRSRKFCSRKCRVKWYKNNPGPNKGRHSSFRMQSAKRLGESCARA
jgi:5-methylcytosine-specific restriction endonuclease McrA